MGSSVVWKNFGETRYILFAACTGCRFKCISCCDGVVAEKKELVFGGMDGAFWEVELCT